MHLRNGKIFAAALGAGCAIFSGQSAASTIVAPVTASATSEFISLNGNNYSIINTINQSGLSLGYVSGVTDLDSYLAANPTHTSEANGTEWFSEDYSQVSQTLKSGKASKASKASKVAKAGKVKKGGKGSKKNGGSQIVNNVGSSSVSGLSVTYGFSELTSINGFVLWNEEFAGIGTTQLLSSIDGITYTLLSTITPTPSTFAPDGTIIPYSAQLFSFSLTTMLFFQLVITDCPGQPSNPSTYRGCGIGEVAFSSAPPSITPEVPVPAALPLLASALGLFAWLGRRQRTR